MSRIQFIEPARGRRRPSDARPPGPTDVSPRRVEADAPARNDGGRRAGRDRGGAGGLAAVPGHRHRLGCGAGGRPGHGHRRRHRRGALRRLPAPGLGAGRRHDVSGLRDRDQVRHVGAGGSHPDRRPPATPGGGLAARPVHAVDPPAGDRRVPLGHRPDDPLHPITGGPGLRGLAHRGGRGAGPALGDAAAAPPDRTHEHWRSAWWRPPRCSACPGSRGGCPRP